MLLSLAASWLQAMAPHQGAYLLIAAGLSAGLIIHHFGFLKVVDKNLARILPMQGRRCLFAFMSWKSYLMVAVMASMGIALRHSPLPKPYLAVLYIAIGLALILSSVRYVRTLVRQLKRSANSDAE